MVSQGLPEDSRGDGTTYSGHVSPDALFCSSDEMVPKSRRDETQTLDKESPYPGNVAFNLRTYALRVPRWLKEDQKRCGQEAPAREAVRAAVPRNAPRRESTRPPARP